MATKARPRTPVRVKEHGVSDEAIRLGVSETFLRDECRAKRFPHRRLGRRILIDPVQADAYLAETGVSVADALKNTAAHLK